MKQLIFISLFLICYFSGFSQVPKDTVNVLNANTLTLNDEPLGDFIYPVLVDGLWQRTSLLGTRKYMGAKIFGNVAFNPSNSGNPLANYNQFVTGSDGATYFIDAFGNSLNFGNVGTDEYQVFANGSGTTFTVTNFTFPTSDTNVKIKVLRGGVKMIEGIDYTLISGNNVKFTLGLDSENVEVFYIK